MTCEKEILNLKTGDSVKLHCVFKDSQDIPKDLTGYTIAADFISNKTGKLLVATSTNTSGITITDAVNGAYTIDAGIALDWPIGEMPVDILYIKEGEPGHTDDFILDFTQGRTKLTIEL